MADTTFLKDNLTGFVPTEQAADIMKDVARGSSVLRLSVVEPMSSDTKQFSVMTDGRGKERERGSLGRCLSGRTT